MTTTKQNDARSRGDWQGMNWIRQEKRLAIYLRDGLACAYCGHGVEQGVQLTLDHVKPHSKGGSNHESNLVTACARCNSSRGARSVIAFSRAVAEYVNHGVQPNEIRRHVTNATRRVLAPYRVQARRLIGQRGSAAQALTDFS